MPLPAARIRAAVCNMVAPCKKDGKKIAPQPAKGKLMDTRGKARMF
ncbi:hypothetical protein DESPIG_00523 [Desulfovibrio piger ATCC 29098]|uniref:Uncharacterized protein n=1 Tax=Desulfovibrio piger ATCC 29098 TaxID=411464 RepID=B6WR42_9BACT|nr:hypothetical protein DESPIG_00523 [Desulfovibrio piger ATCC 29098]